MRMAAAAVVGILIVGGGLGAASSGSAVQAARQTPAYQQGQLQEGHGRSYLRPIEDHSGSHRPGDLGDDRLQGNRSIEVIVVVEADPVVVRSAC